MKHRFTHLSILLTMAPFVLIGLAGCSDNGFESDNNPSDPPTFVSPESPGIGVTADSAAAPTGEVALDPVSQAPPDPTGEPPIDSEQTSFYFSYDESTSTASRDLSLFAINNGLRPAPELGRTFEFLNAESFTPFNPQTVGPFSVSMGMLSTLSSDLPTIGETSESLYALGVNLSGPEQTLEQRRNVVLTVLVDVSGSMESSYASETRSDISSLLDVTRYGLLRLPQSLKAGDVVNLVTFSTEANLLLEGDTGQSALFTDAVSSLATEASTNINEGLQLAYEVAHRTFDPQKANRVLMLTDAYVNTGEVNADIIAQQTVLNDLEGIFFSGVGIGSSFNDDVLDTLTDAGRGSYSAMITPNDAERLFTEGFSRFIEPVFTDVRFRLGYPQQLDQFQSASEEISTNADDIQTVNFSYNSDQFFYELFSGPENVNLDQDIVLDIEYTTVDGLGESASITTSLDQLLSQGEPSIRAAAMVTTLANVISEKLQCEQAMNSMLYTNPVNDEIYTRYSEALTNYCSQFEPYVYVTY